MRDISKNDAIEERQQSSIQNSAAPCCSPSAKPPTELSRAVTLSGASGSRLPSYLLQCSSSSRLPRKPSMAEHVDVLLSAPSLDSSATHAGGAWQMLLAEHWFPSLEIPQACPSYRCLHTTPVQQQQGSRSQSMAPPQTFGKLPAGPSATGEAGGTAAGACAGAAAAAPPPPTRLLIYRARASFSCLERVSCRPIDGSKSHRSGSTCRGNRYQSNDERKLHHVTEPDFALTQCLRLARWHRARPQNNNPPPCDFCLRNEKIIVCVTQV